MESFEATRLPRVINPQLVVLQVENEFGRAGRKYPFFEMRGRVALIQPEILDEPIERRRRYVRTEEQIAPRTYMVQTARQQVV